MWKKFLAVMAVFSLLSTSALAVAGDPMVGENDDNQDYISSFDVSPEPFDPVNDATATVSFDLLQAADIYAYVSNEAYEIVGTFSNYEPTVASPVTYTWHGRVDNLADGEVLADGTYRVKAFASVDGVLVDYDFKDVTLTSLPPVNENAPQVSDLKADPLEFSAHLM